jgi:dolichol kinase
MRLSFGVALAVLLVVEYVRIARVPPLGRAAHAYLRSYTDSRDEGTAILTHVYLLLGCALPLWLFPAYAPATQSHDAMPYAALGGLVVLGAGDAAGAIIGSTLGQVHWPGGRKTLEGTLAATLASLATISLLAVWQLRNQGGLGNVRWHEVLLATLLTCVLEAFTKQIDNLTLPIFYSSLLYLPPNVWRL